MEDVGGVDQIEEFRHFGIQGFFETGLNSLIH
jgi:hypothetical protein